MGPEEESAQEAASIVAATEYLKKECNGTLFKSKFAVIVQTE